MGTHFVTLDSIPDVEREHLSHVVAGEIYQKDHSARFHRGDGTVKRLVREYRERYGTPTIEEPAPPAVPDLDPNENIGRRWKIMEDYQRLVRDDDIPWDHYIDLKDDRPVMIAWVADMHIGHKRSDLRKIRQTLETVRDTEGMYVVFGGDDGENTTSSRANHGAHHERVLDTEEEREFIEYAFSIPGRDKVLGVGEGNHTNRSVQDDGSSWLKKICEQVGIHYYGYRQRFNITIGRWDYRIIYAHRHRGGGLDTTRPSKKIMEDWGPADAAFTAHTHNIATSQEYKQLEERGFGVAGSFKDRDNWAGSMGYTPSQAIMPGCILYPDFPRELEMVFNAFSRRKIATFQAIREGVIA